MKKVKYASRFTVSPTWQLLFKDMQLDVVAVMKEAELSLELFTSKQPTLSAEEYFRLCHALHLFSGDTPFPLLLAKHMSLEAFDAPIFASVSSRNVHQALIRLSQYKPLIGPIVMEVQTLPEGTRLKISHYGHVAPLPVDMAMTEIVFITQLMRIATRMQLQPKQVIVPSMPNKHAEYSHFFGCELEVGAGCQLLFSHQDSKRTLLTHNAQMWTFFEEKLSQRLQNLEKNATLKERVCAVLLEHIAAGDTGIDFVASKLAMSKRTLQRKLSDESMNYQSILQDVRCMLANHYLKETRLPLTEVAFLLGFQEPNSFVRAYTKWQGQSPSQFRQGGESLLMKR